MAPIISTMEIACPPEQAFAYVTDPTRFGEWQRDDVSGAWQGDEPPREKPALTATKILNSG